MLDALICVVALHQEEPSIRGTNSEGDYWCCWRHVHVTTEIGAEDTMEACTLRDGVAIVENFITHEQGAECNAKIARRCDTHLKLILL